MTKHTPTAPYQLRYPGGRDGMWEAECSCGEYRTAPCATPAKATKAVSTHAEAKNAIANGPR